MQQLQLEGKIEQQLNHNRCHLDMYHIVSIIFWTPAHHIHAFIFVFSSAILKRSNIFAVLVMNSGSLPDPPEGMAWAVHPSGPAEDEFGVSFHAVHPALFRLPNFDAKDLSQEWTTVETSEIEAGVAEFFCGENVVEVYDFRALANRIPTAREIFSDLQWWELFHICPQHSHPGCHPPQVFPSLPSGEWAARIVGLLRLAWEDGIKIDSRAIFSSAAGRTRRTHREQMKIMEGRAHCLAVFPGCSWCAWPTGGWRDGTFSSSCGLPLCQRCESVFCVCRRCVIATGIPRSPKTYVNRIIQRRALSLGDPSTTTPTIDSVYSIFMEQ